MKTLMLLIALMGLARYCSKTKEYNMPAQHTHREKLLKAIAPELESQDSLQKTIATKFKETIKTEYPQYQPDNATLTDLKARWNDSISVKVIGGNWCSDTRLELPRLCRVLDGVGAHADSFGYFKVDKDKKPVNNDFATKQSVTRVPTVFVFRDGKLLGQIVETPVKSWEVDLNKLLLLH
ncbi:MAG: thioredoxin family protein [Bacteroidetes bacterium]|nr:thioredoxin family protein [Bacteroidota bacterium]